MCPALSFSTPPAHLVSQSACSKGVIVRLLTAVGVDGCRAGWVCAGWDGGDWSLSLISSLEDLLPLLAPSAVICIDIPIGLSEDGRRACDREARRQLGPRASSVFPAPPRLALQDVPYPEINEESKRRYGRGVSKQAFYLLPKIREAQSLLCRPDASGSQWLETHPELCFCALNDGVPMPHNKKTEAGLSDRLRILASSPMGADVVTLYEGFAAEIPRSRCQRDDIVDALVCGLVASLTKTQRRFVPDDAPEFDALGTAMRICYPVMSECPEG